MGSEMCIRDRGYSEAYVPFCGHRVVEALAEIDTDLVDPFLPKFIEQQPDAAQVAWQCATIDAMAESLGL